MLRSWGVGLVVALMWAWPTDSAWADATEPLSEQVLSAASSAELLSALQPWVSAQLQARVGPVQVQPLGAWRWPRSTQRGTDWRVTWQQPTARQEGWLVSLQATPVGGGQAVALRFLARAQEQVWRLRASVRQGDPIACSALSRDLRSRQAGVRVWQGPCEGLSALVARRALAPGEVLVESDLGPPPAVHRQQVVQVWSRSQGIEIQAEAQVLADASVGQRVPVRLARGGPVLHATVVAPGQLQVLEGIE